MEGRKDERRRKAASDNSVLAVGSRDASTSDHSEHSEQKERERERETVRHRMEILT